MLHRLLLLLLALACATGAELAPAPALRLLAIGNSFSRNALAHFAPLAAAAGREVRIQHLSFGGASLAQHWQRHEGAERGVRDSDTTYKGEGTLAEALAREPWDVVTIQQASILSHDAATYRPYASSLVALIRARAPRARILMHQTWAYRCDDPRYRDSRQAIPTQADMHGRVRAAYHAVAGELGIGLIPVGDAFQAVAEDARWAWRPDPVWDAGQAVAPTLPDQRLSLHAGWSWKTADGRSRPVLDGHHASRSGQFLGACVWLDILLGIDPRGVAYRPDGVEADMAEALKSFAHAAARPGDG